MGLTSKEAITFFDAVGSTHNLIPMKEAASLLSEALIAAGGQAVGHNTLMLLLRNDGCLLSGEASPNDLNHPAADMISRGLMTQRPKPFPFVDAKQRTVVPFFKPKGMQWLLKNYCPLPERHGGTIETEDK